MGTHGQTGIGLMPVEFNRILPGDTLNVLKTLPDECIDCIVTSPPYYGLRDYGVGGQIGLEQSLDDYLEKMLAVTAELHRVLKKTGTLWWNHGDSYGTGSGSGVRTGKQATNRGTQTNLKWQQKGKQKISGYEKCLLMQPYRLAQRMIDEQGWILRNIIIWHKPNCMPSSAKDRFTVDFEPIFFFSKSKNYWFETQYEKRETDPELDVARIRRQRTTELAKGRAGGAATYTNTLAEDEIRRRAMLGRAKRCVWKIATKPFKEAHFATFPETLIELPIRSGCPEIVCKRCGSPIERIGQKIYEPAHSRGNHARKIKGTNSKTSGMAWKDGGWNELPALRISGFQVTGYTDCGCNGGWEGGIVLDPFMGAGTTAVVAQRLGRRWLGIELNPEYIKIAERRISESRYSILKPVKSKRKKFQLDELDEEAV